MCVSSKNFYLTYNNKTAHWVGQSKLKPLYTDDFSKKVIDAIQASLTGITIEQSVSGRKNNPYLLQESEEKEAEEANDYAGVNVEANKIDEENNDIII